ncbi:hypothetical protein [Paenimyroides ceti]
MTDTILNLSDDYLEKIPVIAEKLEKYKHQKLKQNNENGYTQLTIRFENKEAADNFLNEIPTVWLKE